MKKRILSLLAALVLAFPGFGTVRALAEGTGIDTSALDMDYYGRYQDKGYSISVYNWGEYISDGADGSLDVNKAFEEVTGIKVIYSNYDTNESMYAKLKTGGTSYDIVIPSDYMISRMIAEGMLQKLDFSNIPNLHNIEDIYLNQSYDPGNEYSVPYTWGVLGLIYNTRLVEDESVVASWGALWSEAYMDNILMINNSKDAFGITFKYMGAPINAETTEQVDKAVELLKAQKNVIQAYVADEIFDKMIGEEAAIAPYFNGDAVTMIADNPDLAFSIPMEGSNIFTDCLCVPVESQKRELAEMYINFMLEPEVGLANTKPSVIPPPTGWCTSSWMRRPVRIPPPIPPRRSWPAASTTTMSAPKCRCISTANGPRC